MPRPAPGPAAPQKGRRDRPEPVPDPDVLDEGWFRRGWSGDYIGVWGGNGQVEGKVLSRKKKNGIYISVSGKSLCDPHHPLAVAKSQLEFSAMPNTALAREETDPLHWCGQMRIRSGPKSMAGAAHA